MEVKKPTLWSVNFINICIANFFMACSFNLLMPSIPLYITEHLNIPQTKTGIVLSSYAIALLLVRPFSGYLTDIYSRKLLMFIGFATYVCVFGGYFFATTVALFVLVRFIHGLCWGLSTVSSSTLAIDVVPSARRAEGIGYYGTFMNVAMAIGPFAAIHIYKTFGFEILLWCAMAMGTLGIVAIFFIKAPKREPVNKTILSLDRFFLVKGFPIFLNQLLPCFAWGTIGPFVVQYGDQIGISNAGVFFLFWAGGIITSRTFAGKIVDKGYIHQVNMTAMTIITIGFLCFASIHSIYAFCASGLFIGIGFGMLFPGLQTLYIEIAPHTQRGTANSTYLLGFDLGLALGMLLGGFISGIFSFETLYFVSASLCFLSIIVYRLVSKRCFESQRHPDYKSAKL